MNAAVPIDRCAPISQRWTSVVATPLGDTRTTWSVDETTLTRVTDDPFDPGDHRLRWTDILEGGTASLGSIATRGGPEMVGWIPATLDWLLLSTRDGHGFMRRLPPGPDGDALVAALRARLGPRWLGDALPLPALQARLGIAPSAASKLQLVGLVLAVFALLIVGIVVLGLLLTPIVLVPVAVAVGAWLLRRGWIMRRAADAGAVATPVAVAAARPGPTLLSGRTVTADPTPAAVSGRPSAWWDVALYMRYRDEDRTDVWRQVAGRHGGTIDIVTLDDGSGRIPVWLDGAERLIAHDGWESGEGATLPDGGRRLLAELGFAWNGTQRLRLVEERVEVDAPLTVLGTVGRRGDVPPPGPPRGTAALRRALETGSWRRSVVAAAPRALRLPLAVTIAYVDMMARLGTGRARPVRLAATEPPAVPAETAIVWKGTDGAPLIVANRRPAEALALLRRRGWLYVGGGAFALLFAAWSLSDAIGG